MIMEAKEIRKKFFEYFESKGHKIIPSAPIVNKDDPTLMFTNAGMNQFKDYFLGNKTPKHRRIADTQKCLRVSGKHNDLEEVGIDSYHHTMFEMLGNWSFGDYFKKEAIDWAWELLTKQYGLEDDRLYATVFGGDQGENLEPDQEAARLWKQILPEDRVLYFDKKDNFWEMGDTGPCGPCSEIHIDLRSTEERRKIAGQLLVNKDHPLVVEIWNLVFIQFNRKSDGSLVELPAKHVDTGMGFERLCMAVQGKQSNYDTDLFTPFFSWIEKTTGKKYTGKYDRESKKDVAFRVLADHSRAVSFTIADGQLPSNTGAGYVVRRILRRAVRYYFSFLEFKEPLMYQMVPFLASYFEDTFPELKDQAEFVSKIILEEEKSFLRTLESGLRRLSQIEVAHGKLDGKVAFELYDTYGFPIDLTRLIGTEQGWQVDEKGFEEALKEQQDRSRADAHREAGDWSPVHVGSESLFVGYDRQSVKGVKVIKHRTVSEKSKKIHQLVLDKTPFYAESGGQVGDTGFLTFGDEKIRVLDTQKENELIIHFVDRMPKKPSVEAKAEIDAYRRQLIENNHTATHLMHAALREVLGNHVEQRGSLVTEKYLRFDFSHFEKMTEGQIARVEEIVNRRIRENILRREERAVPIEKAKEAGAMMLFGEKYGDRVRVITFDPSYSVELCGGCHVEATGEIGLFKIKSESAIAAGIRRIEAMTAEAAMTYINNMINELNLIKESIALSSPSPTPVPTPAIKKFNKILEEKQELDKELMRYKTDKIRSLKETLIEKFTQVGDIQFLKSKLMDMDMDGAKTLAYDLLKARDHAVVCLSLTNGNKVNLLLAIDRDLAKGKLNAGNLIREMSGHIKGGGGGQPFFATSGGKDPGGIDAAFGHLEQFLRQFVTQNH